MRLRLPFSLARFHARPLFNLNDPRWGRGDAPDGHQAENPQKPQRPDDNQQPPDLDELWSDFSRKLGGFFNGGGQGKPPLPGGRRTPGPQKPANAATGIALLTGVAALIWLGSGFYIVQEGQHAVITQFGK